MGRTIDISKMWSMFKFKHCVSYLQRVDILLAKHNVVFLPTNKIYLLQHVPLYFKITELKRYLCQKKVIFSETKRMIFPLTDSEWHLEMQFSSSIVYSFTDML